MQCSNDSRSRPCKRCAEHPDQAVRASCILKSASERLAKRKYAEESSSASDTCNFDDIDEEMLGNGGAEASKSKCFGRK